MYVLSERLAAQASDGTLVHFTVHEGMEKDFLSKHLYSCIDMLSVPTLEKKLGNIGLWVAFVNARGTQIQ